MDFSEHFQSHILDALRNVGGVLDHDPACTFSLYEDSGNGILAAALDTLNNSLLQAKRREIHSARVLHYARQLPNAADTLPTFANSRDTRVLCYNPCFSSMKHVLYQNYYDELIGGRTPMEKLLTILDEFVARDIFRPLNITSPFRVGISSWDGEDMWVVKILNWPAHEGPRV